MSIISKKKPKVLFIGNFLSLKKGTQSPTETIFYQLIGEGYKVSKSSSELNQLLRLVSIISSLLVSKAPLIHIDVFSGRAFEIARIGAYLAKLRKKKLVFTLHGGGLPNFTMNNRKKVLKVLCKADYIQSPSKGLIEVFEKYSLKVNYLPNPIVLNNFPFVLNKPCRNKILWVRAFHEIYNPLFVVDVLFELYKINPDVSLTMVGPDKGLLGEVKRKISLLNLESVINIAGAIPNAQLKEFYHSHNIFINTPSMESFGVAVAESAACGTPIVSFDVGEIPLLWEDRNDIMLVPILNLEFMVSSIAYLLDNPDACLLLSRNARSKVEKFDIDQVVDAWKNIIKGT